ncbi:MAG TPA: aldehyde dehydrogenase family protein [Steroidobacteraceae bacterium]
MKTGQLFIGGEWIEGASSFVVEDKFTGEKVATVAAASREQVSQAVSAAVNAFARQQLSPYARYEILHRAAGLLGSRRNEFSTTIVAESGFTITDGENEVARGIQTLLISAEEAKRIVGEVVPIDGAPGQEHRMAFTIRSPVGVVCAITPFNSPLNTVIHKVAPALAAGNAVVLKPAMQTPLTAELLCRILTEAGLPPGYLNLVHGNGPDVGAWLLEDPRIAFYTFTGSTNVGRIIQRTIGLRRSQLELGSISSTIVCEDADLARAVPRCVNASFRKAGQVCTSVQRLYVSKSIMDKFVAALLEATKQARVGDPKDPETLVGPMISAREAERAAAWVDEAVAQGARLVCGGRREGALFFPTILLNANTSMRVMCDEIFAPVISIVPYESLDAAMAEINATPYGLAAGIFTGNINTAMKAARRLQVGTVHINETSSSRVDVMPYGGIKDSGFGREGPKYSIDEMTDERLVTWSLS